jgi:hypothetical protein
MDRGCPFHYDLPPDMPAAMDELEELPGPRPVERKKRATAGDRDEAAT